MRSKFVIPDGFLVRFHVPRNAFPNVERLKGEYAEGRPAAEVFTAVNAAQLFQGLRDHHLACDMIRARGKPPDRTSPPGDVVSLCFRRGKTLPLATTLKYVLAQLEEMSFREAVMLAPAEPSLVLTLEFRSPVIGIPTHPLIITDEGSFEVDTSPEVA